MRLQRHRQPAALLAICLGLSLFVGAALAETMRIGAVNPDKGYIVLSDRVFLLTPATRVLNSSGAPITATSLRKGVNVTIRVQSATPGSRPVLEEIRISP